MSELLELFVAPYAAVSSCSHMVDSVQQSYLSNISQDEIDTFTVHLSFPLDVDTDKIDSKDAIYRALGGMYDDLSLILMRFLFG